VWHLIGVREQLYHVCIKLSDSVSCRVFRESYSVQQSSDKPSLVNQQQPQQRQSQQHTGNPMGSSNAFSPHQVNFCCCLLFCFLCNQRRFNCWNFFVAQQPQPQSHIVVKFTASSSDQVNFCCCVCLRFNRVNCIFSTIFVAASRAQLLLLIHDGGICSVFDVNLQNMDGESVAHMPSRNNQQQSLVLGRSNAFSPDQVKFVFVNMCRLN
jgi:hypothetical protein